MHECEARKAAGLSAPERLSYHDNGFIVVRNLFDDHEPLAWRAECERLLQFLETQETDDLRIDVKGHASLGRVRDRLDPVIDISPMFRSLASDSRLLAAVESVLGGPATLFKDKLIFKRPGTSGYRTHQDYASYGQSDLPADAIVTVLVSIDPADAINGALKIFPKLHAKPLPSRPGDPRNLDESQLDMTAAQVMATGARDVIIFHALAPHRSGPNRSDQSRRALFFTFSAARFASKYADYYRHRSHVMARSRSLWNRLWSKFSGQARVR